MIFVFFKVSLALLVCPRYMVVMARLWWSACCLTNETGTPLPSMLVMPVSLRL